MKWKLYQFHLFLKCVLVNQKVNTEQQPHTQDGAWLYGGYNKWTWGGPGPQEPEPGLDPHLNIGKTSTHTETAKQTCKDGQGGWALLPPEPHSKNTGCFISQVKRSIFPTVITRHPPPWSFRPWAQRYSAILRCLYLGAVLRLHLTTACLELFWQLGPSEQLLFVTEMLVPAGLGLEPKMEFYS